MSKRTTKPKSKQDTKTKRWFAVMRAMSWGSIKVGPTAIPLTSNEEGPQAFIALFESAEQAKDCGFRNGAPVVVVKVVA